MIKKLVKPFCTRSSSSTPETPPKQFQHIIIPRAEHGISRKAISLHALKVLYRLHQAGYQAYLVGGCVRDLLMNHPPKDFDVATNALPEQIRKLFKNCILIGRRFRLAHIRFGKEIIEVATFRAELKDDSEQDSRTTRGMIIRDNIYGAIEEDAQRRDFTINALYYNIADFSVVDFTQGMADIQSRQLRMIGNPENRYQEDPVRLLRAIRFMAKLKLNITPETELPITRLSCLLQDISSARLFQETLKLFSEGAATEIFNLLHKYHLFEQLFPQTAALLHQPSTWQLIQLALKSTDERLQQNKSTSPAFLFAVMLWPVVRHEVEIRKIKSPHPAKIEPIIHAMLKIQKLRLDLPKRLLSPIQEICLLQYRLQRRQGKQPFRLLNHPRFRAAYDLLLLRAQSGEPVKALANWWTNFQVTAHDTELALNIVKKEEKSK